MITTRFGVFIASTAALSTLVAAGLIIPDADAGGSSCIGGIGPDVIVGVLPNVANYPSQGGIEAFAVGTTSCNIGDEELEWFAGINRHPVIGQNMYRLNNGRFEQVGQAWLKHGFAALQGNACSCGCTPSGTSTFLGVGCSDPYSAGLNGGQNPLGPKSEVNAFSGLFTYPPADPPWSGSVARRLQVKITDLDPADDGGGQYYIEGQYVAPDDAEAFNHYNNVSYRPINVSGSGSSWAIALTGSTQRESPAIEAWADADPFVSITTADVPGDGRLYLAWKTTDLGRGVWNYEFALYNMNSDRSVRSFAVPLPAGTTVSNTGFHDVDYHSGEQYDGTDWAVTTGGPVVMWSTDDEDTDPNANALRWGTLYNFRFDANAAPSEVLDVVLGLYKPGTPDTVTISLDGGPGAPANDNCDNRLVLGLGSFGFDNVGATTDGPDEDGFCNKFGYSQIDSDVWFSYTAICSGPTTVSLCGSDYDTKMAVYQDACPTGPGESVACNDDTCELQSEVTFEATLGVEYLIRIGGYEGEQGTGVVDIACDGGASGNDDCDGPEPIGNGGFPYDTTQATTDGPAHAECQFDGQTYEDIWFEYTAICDGDLFVSTCGNADYDTDLVVYDNTDCGALSLLGCNDDADGCSGFTSELTVSVNEGQTYLIRVGGWNAGDAGTGVLTVDGPVKPCSGGGGPANDLCADADAIGDGTTAYTTVDAETDGPSHAECQFDGQTYEDVWYEYTATCDGDLTVSTCDDADYDTDLVVYDGNDCGDLNLLGCNDDAEGCAGFTSEITVSVTKGAAYLIRVGGWNAGDEGTGNLTIGCVGDPTCVGDLTDDGFVDAADLASLLAAWGPNPGNDADFNGDDVVDAADLATLLANWGPCP